MWPCSYDHRELDTGSIVGSTKVELYESPAAAAFDDAAKLVFKDQLIFNNSIFCTRWLFSESTLHAACKKNMVKPHDLLVPVS